MVSGNGDERARCLRMNICSRYLSRRRAKMKLFDLSFRYKIPIWGSLLILVTAFAVSGSLMVEAYDELTEDLIIDAKLLGRALAAGLFPAMLNEDSWRAAETVSEPVVGRNGTYPLQAETIFVVDNQLRVYAASHPKLTPLRSGLATLGPEYAVLAEQIPKIGEYDSQLVDVPSSNSIYVATPVAKDGVHLGTLIVVCDRKVFLPRFMHISWHGWFVGALVLAVLLPINWYWGQRMTRPLVQLTTSMSELGTRLPTDLDPDLYVHDDELGRLFKAYNEMLAELKAKDELEKQMVQSERLAALGQLAAGVAHEINNPLGGMLTAIDTLRCHGELDPRTSRTIALIERGLAQIKDTVSALLVEAKLKSRDLTPQDIEDVRTLIAPQARKKALHIGWRNSLDRDLELPATLVRQIMINLLLNAVQAATQQGEVDCEIGLHESTLQIAVANDGKTLTADQMQHLFEPFSPLSEGGHGLGLWVTYQIVHQLGGYIAAARDNGKMRFSVSIPCGEKA
jgi:two-component system NtrC family sensor kinase